MKKISLQAFVVFIFLGLSFSLWKFSYPPAPQSQDLASNNPELSADLLKDAQGFLQVIQDPTKLNYENCPVVLHEFYQAFGAADPNIYDLNLAKQNHLQIINTFWQIRLALHDRLTDFTQKNIVKSGSTNDACVNAIRDTIRLARFTEDYVGELFLGIPPFDEKKDPVSINTLQGEAPHLLKANGVKTVTLRSGDLIISRGAAYTSAAIARIGEVQSQFSHLAVVYIENEPFGKEFTIAEAMQNPNVKMLEAHIEIGSTIRPFKEYVADGNVRNFLFRYNNAKKAADAAKWAHDFLVQHRIDAQKKNGGALDDPNNNVPYDFQMNLGDFKEIFCSEMGYLAYQSVGLILPEFPTTLEAHNDVVKTLGIKQLVNFAPGDLELDTRFTPIAEWRDYRKVHTTRFKDAALSAMFRWMKNRDYTFHSNTLMDAKALFAWLARHADLSFAKTQLAKNMPVSNLQMVFSIDKVGTALENYLTTSEKAYQKTTGRLYTADQMAKLLDAFREKDAKDYMAMNSSAFHFEFHSHDEAVKRQQADNLNFTK